jgi:FtsP/CotA-like multicopper oxidase with cupredoxin domain
MGLTRRSALAVGLGAFAAAGARASTGMRIETTVTHMRVRPFGDEGPEIDAIGFDGVFGAGPLRLTRGVPVTLAIRNGMDRPFAPFLHGLRGAPAFQGVPGFTRTALLAPGSIEEATFVPREAGTYILRAFGDDALQASGLVRAVVIADDGAVDADTDEVLLIHDLPPGATVPEGVDGARGFLINGRRPPVDLDMVAGTRSRLRFVNGSTQDRDAIGIRNGIVVMGSARYAEIARDGTALLDPYAAPNRAIIVRPGQRVDALLDSTAHENPRIPVRSHDATFRYRIVDGGGPRPASRAEQIPFRPLLAPPRPRIDLARATRVDLPITAVGDRLRLGRQTGDPVRRPPLFRIAVGRTVVLRLEARIPGGALLHLQGHAAYVLDALDDGVQPWLLDTIDVPADRAVTIAFRASERGRWFFGAVSGREVERGLGGWYEVT